MDYMMGHGASQHLRKEYENEKMKDIRKGRGLLQNREIKYA